MPRWTKEQQEAIEKDGSNIIVSAGAGSGKTAVLTSRVINKLKKGIHINELLILTFTKAAAEEMKERIRSAIKEDETLKEELNYIDSAYITTFDSYSLSVVKKYHYKLNIPSNVGITDSNLLLMKKKEIIDQIFEKYYQLEEENFSKMIYDFCVKNDDDIKKTILQIANKIELLINKKDFLQNYLETYFSNETIEKLIEEYKSLILEKRDDIKSELESFSYKSDKDYYQKVAISLNELLNTDDIDTLISLEVSLPQARNCDEETKIAKDQLKKSIDELLKYKNYGLLNEVKENILLSKNTIIVIINILKEYFEILESYKRENDVYDFQDIALLSIELVKEFEDVRNEIKESFKEIMIDEYQDTNDIQETFITQISNNNVYMVGDIKQSIYRFRNANPYIFKNKYDNYSKLNGGIKIDLLKNFRSRNEVLDNINKIFNAIMDDYLGGADYITSHQMVFGNTTYIEEGKTTQDYNMEFLQYEKHDKYTQDEIEIFAIGRDIQNKVKNKYQIFDKGKKELHDATYNDFVILMDRSTKFDLYKKVFEYLGIPLTIYKDEKLNDGYDLLVIKSLIDLVIKINKQEFDTQFKYDFISIARSYLYNLDDNEIFEYFSNNKFKESSIYKDLNSIAENIKSKSITETITSIIEATNLYEKLTTVGNINNSIIKIQKILETAENLNAIGYDIIKFNEYLETLINEGYDLKYSVDNNSSNSVRIMTIHKSKGLEYNICYFSGLDKTFNISDIKEKFTYSNKYGIIAPIFKEGIRENIIKELLKRDYLVEEISEKIRLLYVAVTRAKEKMIFLIPNKDDVDTHKDFNGVVENNYRKKYRSFMDIINSIKKDLKQNIINIPIEELNISKDYLFTKENSFNDKNIKELNVQEINIINETITSNSFSKKLHELVDEQKHKNLEFGLNVHEVLELLDFKNPNYELIENLFIKNKVMQFLNSELLKNIKDAKLYKEYEFIYEKDQVELHGIIDLMIEYEDYIDIIDYKLSNIEDENYIKQLNGYKDYISNKSNKEINVYLYSILGSEIKKIS